MLRDQNVRWTRIYSVSDAHRLRAYCAEPGRPLQRRHRALRGTALARAARLCLRHLLPGQWALRGQVDGFPWRVCRPVSPRRAGLVGQADPLYREQLSEMAVQLPERGNRLSQLPDVLA